MKITSMILVVLFLLIAQSTPSAFAQNNSEERDIVKKVETGMVHGAKVTILQRKTESFVAVLPNSQFKKGDRIKVEVESNFSGYLYMINLGSSGKASVVFPDRDADNKISRGRKYLLPHSYDLEFDGNSGVDVFKVIMSLRPIPVFQNAASTEDGRLDEIALKELKSILSMHEAQQFGINRMEFNQKSRVGGFDAVGTREPIWNTQKKASLMTILQKNKTPGRLQANQAAIFGMKFQNLGSTN